MDNLDPLPGAIEPSAPGDRLDSWKEIAAYLRRDITTVRRWEKREGLPVHRHLHERRDSVYAFRSEIDGWWRGRRNQLVDHEANGADSATVPPPGTLTKPARRSWRVSATWVLAAACLITTLVLAAVVALGVGTAGPGDSTELRFSVFPPDGAQFGNVALSPDGRQLAFTASIGSSGGRAMLWMRPLDTLAARVLPETEDAAMPFWSPTGDSLGFFAGGKLWVIDATGGSPRPLADAPRGRGGSWNRDGTIVFSPDREGPLSRVAAAGGPVTVETLLAPGERGHLWPHFLPDGRHFLYLADSNVPEHHNLFVGDLESDAGTVLLPRASSNAMYGAGGFLFFAQGRNLVARAFDADRLEFSETDVTIIDAVNRHQELDHLMEFSVAGTSMLAYRAMQSPAARLVWRDRRQVLQTVTSEAAEYFEPVLSPDGNRVAVDIFDPRPSPRFGYGLAEIRSDVVLLDPTTAAMTPLASDPGADWGPVWSPDGRTLVYSSNRREKNLELYLKSLTPDRPEELLLEARDTNPVAQSWSPDGKYLIYAAFDPQTHSDLWLLPMSGERTPTPLLNAPHNEMQGQISPDGHWFAYSSDESGRLEVYVQSFPGPGPKWHISSDGGADPRWSHDGKELFYVANDRRLMAVSVKLNGAFEHGTPVPLFDTGMPPWWYEARNVYDVRPDGRFLFMQPVEDDRLSPLMMIVNSAALLRR
jgi:Tol biopolymer transport system component